jgi:adenosylmethionine-8-amino-7-oxononanoate aminotransferase
MSLSARDQAAIWHPYTQHKTSTAPVPFVSGKGAYLFDEKGKRYLDLISSWWVTLHGHAEPEVAKAIYEQAMQLEHVIFSGCTHEPAIELAEKLLALLPTGFEKIFYSDNGSTAVEVALKMAHQYWRNLGETNRTRFIAFEGGYHGDTVGAMSVGFGCGFYSQYSNMLFDVDMMPYPATWIGDEDQVLEKEKQALDRIGAHLAQYGKDVSSIIIEPLIQGSGGMRMCTPRFLRALEKLVRAHGILIIYDEVMTGFGRIGDYFACLKAQTVPDIICLSKGLSAGFLPLAVTACQDKIYQAFLGDTVAKALIHGHSFTGNPLGCAAALASMKILQRAETQQKIALLEKIHREELTRVVASGAVEKARYCGTISAFDFKIEGAYGSQQSRDIQNNFVAQGLLMRPLGKTFYFMPPFCISEAELRGAYTIVIKELQGVIA